MATVPELKIIAEQLGVKITSKMLKADIQAAIEGKREELRQIGTSAEREADLAAARQAESDSKPVTAPTPTGAEAERCEAVRVAKPRLNLATLARLAGSMGRSAAPMHNRTRAGIYAVQTGRALLDPFSRAEPTPAQSRRMRKKLNRTFKVS